MLKEIKVNKTSLVRFNSEIPWKPANRGFELNWKVLFCYLQGMNALSRMYSRITKREAYGFYLVSAHYSLRPIRFLRFSYSIHIFTFPVPVLVPTSFSNDFEDAAIFFTKVNNNKYRYLLFILFCWQKNLLKLAVKN